MNDNDLMLGVFRVARLHSRLFHSTLDSSGVDGNMHDGLILHILSEEDGIAQKELARRMHNRPQSLTGALEKLEKDGFIERHRSESDKREQIVYITEPGLEREKIQAKVRDKSVEKLFAVLDKEEKKELYKLLDKIASQDLGL